MEGIKVALITVAVTVSFGCFAQAPKAAGKQPANKNQASVYSEPYDFKGVARLGMTLSEFKAAPVPEEGEKSPNYGPPSAWCGNDRFATLGVADVAGKAGVVYCSWVQRRSSGQFVDLHDVHVRIAGQRMEKYWFEFIAKPGDAEPRLFRMDFRYKDRPNAVTEAYGVIGAALAERFGKPMAAKVRPVQNAFGAVFEQEMRGWANKHGEIVLMRFEESLEWMSLRYFIPEYVDYYETRWTEEQTKKGPKL